MKPDKEKHLKIATQFIKTYCKANHGTDGKELCTECTDLLEYAQGRLERCPYDPKPKCKECETHCYKPVYRKKIQEVMRFSGIHFVKRGRIDWLFKYFLR
ncbi:nitrous oxide-stimulated promoter family protein [Candidatus Latescibacterota bacterium]